MTGRLASAGLITAMAASHAAAGHAPQLPGFLNALSGPLQDYGLWAIIVLVFLEDFGIPLPGETILIAGAVYAGSGGLNVVAVGVSGFAAAVLGDNVGYAIGRYGGRALISRWGRYVFLTEERLDKAEAFFNRHGGKIIAIARFIEGLRQANGLIAGITSMRWVRFLLFNMIGAALWVGCWVSVGYFAGQHITTIYDYVTRYSLYAVVVAVVAIAAWIALRVRKKRREQAAKGEAGKTDEADDADEAEAEPGGPGEVEATTTEKRTDEAEAEEPGAETAEKTESQASDKS